MPKDPIVDKVHKIREKLLQEHGGMEGYMRHIQELQTELKDRVVRRSPRRPITTAHKVS